MNRGHGMMKRLIAVLALAFATAIPLMADTWTDPDTGYTWMYRINGETVEVVNPSYYAAISPSPNGNVAVPNTLGGMPVTCIGDSAFYNCSDLTSVTIPNSITNIGPYAFESCSSLMSVTIPNSVTNIGDSAFQDCSGLMSVMFMGDAPSVGRSAFYLVGSGCTVYVKKGSTGWGVDIPGTWNGLAIQCMTPEIEWLADRELVADALTANGRTAAECYALGLDPTDATNDFRIVSIELVDGKPKVEWEPKTNRWTGAEIQAVLKGAEALDGEWQTVTEGNKAGFRFFKVVVELP